MTKLAKRKHARAKFCLAVGLDGQEQRSGVGVTRDASASGVLLVSSRRYAAGEQLVLQIRRGEGQAPIEAVGTVVRVERDKTDAAQFFPWRIAIELREPVEQLSELVGELEIRKST
jgi:hypothetical protein